MTALHLAPLGFVGGLAIFWGVAFWILLIGLIALLVGRTRTTAQASGGPPVGLLEERYARGEITREEFLERRAVLDEGSPGARRDDSR